MKKIIVICLLLVTTFTVKAQEYFELKTYEENGKYGLLDENGKKITIAKYDKFSPKFYEGLCSVKLNNRRGFINIKGEEIIKLLYQDVREFNEGFAAVMSSGYWGYIDKTGKESIYPMFVNAYDFKNGFARVAKKDSHIPIQSCYAYIGKNGTRITDFLYANSSGDFYNGFAIVENCFTFGKGVIDISGNEIIKPDYSNEKITFRDGIFFVTKKGIYDELKFDKNGKLIK